MRVTIIKAATGSLDGVRLNRLKVGRTYDLTPGVATALLLEGYAIAEMRVRDRRTGPRPGQTTDRRRK